MIRGIGIDAVEVARFTTWQDYSDQKLKRILSPKEIAYCLSVAIKAPERFAAHFATREAFFKALSAAYPDHTIPFLTLCKKIELSANTRSAPLLVVDWSALALEPLQTHISITHTRSTATVIVILD
jgi:phosphopantetheine--protein transferase-like protein